MNNNTIVIPVSAAELIDKITILEIKARRIGEKEKLINIKRELTGLKHVYSETIEETMELRGLTESLREVNEKLWVTENKKRLCEKNKEFGPIFVEASRLVYMSNDMRSEIKKKINLLLNSQITEEKSYTKY